MQEIVVDIFNSFMLQIPDNYKGEFAVNFSKYFCCDCYEEIDACYVDFSTSEDRRNEYYHIIFRDMLLTKCECFYLFKDSKWTGSQLHW